MQKIVASLTLAATLTSAAFGQVSLTALNSAYTQNFDTLSNTAGSTTNNLVLTGWSMTETGGGARDNEQYAVDTGASNTGDTYSYGTAASTDRALGSLRSGTLISSFGVRFINNTGVTLTSLAVAYTGEQWRLGALNRTDTLKFEYSLDATSLTTGTWTAVAALDFLTFATTGSIGSTNGNSLTYQTSLSATIGSLSIPNASTVFFRWSDLDAPASADDGLAIDNFSVTAIPEPSTYAAIFGALALAGVCVHRRRQARR